MAPVRPRNHIKSGKKLTKETYFKCKLHNVDSISAVKMNTYWFLSGEIEHFSCGEVQQYWTSVDWYEDVTWWAFHLLALLF